MIDNRVMFNAAVNYGQDQAAQLKQPQAAQAFLATHQVNKTSQLKSEGRIADIEEHDDSSALKNEREGDGEGYQGNSRKREKEPEDDLPGITLGENRRVVMHGPNNPLRFDASV